MADISELAANMREFGQQQPIVVQKKGDKFEILIGQRRFLAARELGWATLEAKIVSGLDEVQATIISLSENVVRRDLAPRDKADACAFLRQQLGSVRAVAERLGVSEGTVRKWLGYAAVPDAIKDLVQAGKISVPTALNLTKSVPDEGRAIAIAQRVAEMGPVKEDRDRILAAVEEAPNQPVDAIIRRAEQMRTEKAVVVVLPEKWGRALGRAATALSADESDIARDAVIEWLETRRY